MKDIEGFFIVWPEKRLVSSAQIESWYADAVADNEMEDEYLDAKDLISKAQALHGMGYITLRQKEY